MQIGLRNIHKYALKFQLLRHTLDWKKNRLDEKRMVAFLLRKREKKLRSTQILDFNGKQIASAS